MRSVLLILLLVVHSLFAAELRDNTLYLEINLANAATLNLKASGGSVEIADESLLFARSLNGSFTVSVVNPDATTLYGILERISEGLPNDEAVSRQSFVWEAEGLLIKQELQYFYPQSFSSLESAQNYALDQGFAFSSIRAIPIVNSTLMVEDSSGLQYYYESPLQLKSSGQLMVNGLPYADEFVLSISQGKLRLNQIVPLEEYIAGVLPNEIGSNSPLEALKAQAVAARTHAVSLLLYNRHRDQGYDLCSSTHCQVYKGKHLRNALIEEAVMQTAGEILNVEGRVADATYHSSCGGKTDASSKIWKGAPVAHLSGSLCYPEAVDYDLSQETEAVRWLEHHPDTRGMSSWEKASLSWQRSISRTQLAKNVGLKQLSHIQIIERGSSGRILKLSLSGERELVLDNEFKIRQAFGNLPSSFFYLQGMQGKTSMQLPATLTMLGRGSGHGVGLCQVGALRKARAGSSYLEILETYYPQTTINYHWMHYED